MHIAWTCNAYIMWLWFVIDRGAEQYASFASSHSAIYDRIFEWRRRAHLAPLEIISLSHLCGCDAASKWGVYSRWVAAMRPRDGWRPRDGMLNGTLCSATLVSLSVDKILRIYILLYILVYLLYIYWWMHKLICNLRFAQLFVLYVRFKMYTYKVF